MLGKFIVFEGVEGSGKTTQIQQALAWITEAGWAQQIMAAYGLQPPVAVVTREPGGTKLGQQLRQLLLDPSLSVAEAITPEAELLLYAADRAQHVVQWIQPQLAAGKIVLCDRFTASTLAYQGYGRQISLDLIDQVNRLATFGLSPDLTLWFNLDIQVGLQRAQQRNAQAGPDRMEANEEEFHQRVAHGFAAIAEADPATHMIDGNANLETVTDQVRSILQRHFEQWYPRPLPS
ncbi:dTMP kinase [Lyngbya confervoides]|uniref:Thymidylate kinase n=1 Tax=Lyngbya confervoides BDU141951 TaxID=1574623 RepID=A0ABD4T844_9CYAN|nr:dTMP kinase [Lyngbya confervoides]MCM1984731.1 dTMP kinase [Lyngbya confervoides BDU141951]